VLQWGLACLSGVCALHAPVLAAEPSAQELEFFEKRVRPVLTEHCFKCHSADAEKLKGGLMLDSREAVLKGGDTGPAIVPGDVEKSLLVEAVRWKDSDTAMPPKKALAPAQVADLEAWVKAGAPWPAEQKVAGTKRPQFDLQKRRGEHWCWQPVQAAQAPKVGDAKWPVSSSDAFLLAALESKGIKPAPPADRATLIRRASFDLTGLPPTPAEVEAFVADSAPEAFAKVVDRLLASPHFGERWARHWMDLVRYAETRGHEFEPLIPNAWQYRDYLVRAFNADVPYQQFAMEHLAGDLIPARVDAKTGANESILGTGFWMLGEEVHSPVDIRQDEADRMDNRIDVMGKTFLGLTIGCARCHDHKFDAVSQKDYHALTGFLISSGYRQARFESMEVHRVLASELAQWRAAAAPQLAKAAGRALQPGINRAARFLLAAAEVRRGGDAAVVAAREQLAGEELQGWVAELESTAKAPAHPLHPFAVANQKLGADPAKFAAGAARLGADLAAKPGQVEAEDTVVDYAALKPGQWLQDGVSFGSEPLRPGALLFQTGSPFPLAGVNTRGAAVRDGFWSGLEVKGAERDHGKLGEKERGERTLRTPEFTMKGDRLWYLVKGAGTAYAVVDSHLVVAGPLHGAVITEWKAEAADAGWRWVSQGLGAYAGHRLHVEFNPVGAGEFAVAKVVRGGTRPPQGESTVGLMSGALRSAGSLEGLAGAVQDILAKAAKRLEESHWDRPEEEAQWAAVADWLVRTRALWIRAGSAEERQLHADCAEFVGGQEKLAARIRVNSATAPAMFDGSGVDDFLLVRGQAKTPGAQVPRRFVEALAGPGPMAIAQGSGRLELARAVASPDNPLFARVAVNRVWQHLFGRGLVATVDNFGVQGEKPTHPELLDHLAKRFVGELKWSLKGLMRELVLSRAYQMGSAPTDALAEMADPENLLLHRMSVRRLESEAIRDAILAVSGRLERKVGGPSVPVHLTEFMQGRGRPGKNGPLDGAGRRSVYVAVRRNFLSPMMLTFDTPIPFNSMGRRNVSNVPAQALILMNDPFVVEQAGVWARGLDRAAGVSERIRAMYLRAFARIPTAEEASQLEAFVTGQAQLEQGADVLSEKVWADVAHVLINTKEFIYLH